VFRGNFSVLQRYPQSVFQYVDTTVIKLVGQRGGAGGHTTERRSLRGPVSFTDSTF